ncbi:BAHD acyltransferase DCR, partial [Striga hermonthica]
MAGEIPKEEKKPEAGNVKILDKANVKPKKPIGRQECQLVTFDLPYLAFFYNQKLLVYKNCEDFEAVVEKLKDGLALVLEEFYQLAGKLDKDEDGVFKVVYDDGDAVGVEVVTAAAEEIAVAELTAEEGTSKFKELLPYNGVLNLEGLQRPLLAVQ